MMTERITVERTVQGKVKPEGEKLGFGTSFTDHMFCMEYEEGQAWCRPRIVPYQPIMLDPAAKAFHYGQTVFEGMKAFRSSDGRILLFRPREHVARLNRSNARLSIPPLDEELVVEAIRQLVRLDQDWIPRGEGTSLYIRPFIIATEPALGVAPSRSYRMLVILSPVGSYYIGGLQPVSIHVETEHVRAVPGGLGDAKTAGNYAAGLKAQQEAARGGYAQVLWLDAIHRRYIEEVGSMNIFFRIEDKVVTPALSGSFLAGVTRDAVLQLLRQWGVAVEERPISIDEVAEAGSKGTLKEAFGTGTAAVISPVGELHWRGEQLRVGDGRIGTCGARLYETLTGIQRGTLPDPFGWMVEAVDH